MKINRNDLVNRMVDRCSDPVYPISENRRVAQNSLANAVAVITDAISHGEAVQIDGFGIFEPKLRKSRRIIDPSGRERIVPAQTVVKFRAYKSLQEAVHQVCHH